MTEEMLRKYIALYHAAVFRLAYSYLKNRADAEDICEEAFIKLYSCNNSFETDENCKAWLMRVTVNLSKNMLKSCWFSRRTELDESIPAQENENSFLSEQLKKQASKSAAFTLKQPKLNKFKAFCTENSTESFFRVALKKIPCYNYIITFFTEDKL